MVESSNTMGATDWKRNPVFFTLRLKEFEEIFEKNSAKSIVKTWHVLHLLSTVALLSPFVYHLKQSKSCWTVHPRWCYAVLQTLTFFFLVTRLIPPSSLSLKITRPDLQWFSCRHVMMVCMLLVALQLCDVKVALLLQIWYVDVRGTFSKRFPMTGRGISFELSDFIQSLIR